MILLILLVISQNVFTKFLFDNIQRSNECVNLSKCIAEINKLYFKSCDLIIAVDIDFIFSFPIVFQSSAKDMELSTIRPNVYIVSSGKIDDQLSKLSRLTLFNPRAKFVVISEYVNEELFKILSAYFINNVIVIHWNGYSTQNIYSYNPYSNRIFNEVNLNYTIVGNCTEGKLQEYGSFFVDRDLETWKKAVLKVVYNIQPPYTICSNCEEKGIEFNIFELVGDKLNVKYDFTELGYDYWGDKINGTYTHALGVFQNGNADMIFGGFCVRSDENLDFDVTFPYMEDALRWTTPKARLVPQWKRLTLCFNPQVWLYILLSAILVILVWFLLNSEKCKLILGGLDAMFYVIQISTELSLEKIPRRLSGKLLMIFWIYSVLILNTLIRSRLIFILTGDNHEFQPQTLQDVNKMGMHPFVARIANPSIPIEKFLLENYIPCDFGLGCLNRTAFVGDMATVKVGRYVKHFAPKLFLDDKGRALLHVTKAQVIQLLIASYFTRGHPLFPLINKQLIRLKETGFVDYYYKIVEAKNEKSLALAYRRGELNTKKLNLENVESGIIIWILGLGSSFIVFVTEILLYYVAKSL